MRERRINFFPDLRSVSSALRNTNELKYIPATRGFNQSAQPGISMLITYSLGLLTDHIISPPVLSPQKSRSAKSEPVLKTKG